MIYVYLPNFLGIKKHFFTPHPFSKRHAECWKKPTADSLSPLELYPFYSTQGSLFYWPLSTHFPHLPRLQFFSIQGWSSFLPTFIHTYTFFSPMYNITLTMNSLILLLHSSACTNWERGHKSTPSLNKILVYTACICC